MVTPYAGKHYLMFPDKITTMFHLWMNQIVTIKNRAYFEIGHQGHENLKFEN